MAVATAMPIWEGQLHAAALIGPTSIRERRPPVCHGVVKAL
jgi:hypothetical protein